MKAYTYHQSFIFIFKPHAILAIMVSTKTAGFILDVWTCVSLMIFSVHFNARRKEDDETNIVVF